MTINFGTGLPTFCCWLQGWKDKVVTHISVQSVIGVSDGGDLVLPCVVHVALVVVVLPVCDDARLGRGVGHARMEAANQAHSSGVAAAVGLSIDLGDHGCQAEKVGRGSRWLRCMREG